MAMVNLGSTMIDRDSATPLYQQVREALEQLLKSGTYASGDLMPTEEELCDKFQVSRITVRKATEELVMRDTWLRGRGREPLLPGRRSSVTC